MATVDMLEELGHSVSEAGAAEEALDMLDKSQPDIVLTDLGLPGMDGETSATRSGAVGRQLRLSLLPA